MNLFEFWRTRESGLTEEEVNERRLEYGANIIESKNKKTILDLFIEEVKQPLNIILIIAAAGSLFISFKENSGFIDVYVIVVAVLINIIISIIQTKKTDETFEKLNESKELEILVIRGGKKEVIPIEELVVGDIINLESGDKVPADLIIFSSRNLKIDESSFTGESMSVKKGVLDNNNENDDIIFSGTVVVSGQAQAIVTAVGEKTEFGKILVSLKNIEKRKSPMEKKMQKITFLITKIAIIATILIIVVGFIKGKDIFEIVILGIAVAVSAIPEGIGASISAALSVGAYRILKKGGLVKDLVSAETLASVDTVLTDKTGTLTEGNMTLEKIFSDLNSPIDAKIIAILASAPFWDYRNEKYSGDEMDVAIANSLKVDGLDFDKINSDNYLIDELPFNSKNKFYASLRETTDGINKDRKIYVKGAPEKILEACERIQTKDGVKEFNVMEKYKFFETFKKGQSANSRFLAFAYRDTNFKLLPQENDVILNDLIFVSLVSFSDPLKKNIENVISEIKSMGTDVIMVTGDSKEIAYDIASKTGIVRDDYDNKVKVIEGEKMDKMTEEEIFEATKKTKIFARVSPDNKLKLANAMIKGGRTIAMTGDGVNDVLALSKADIGISFKNASDAAQETASLVLIKNDFRIITHAIQEGRNIIENIRKTVIYLLSSSFTEIIVISGALLIGGPLPFLTVHILWANIIEEGLMNFSFIFGKNKEAVTMAGKFNSKILTEEVKKTMIAIGIFDATTTLGLYYYLTTLGISDIKLQSLMFLALTLDFFFITLSLQNLRKPIWKENLFSNMYLNIALFVGISLLSITVFTEKGREIMHLEKFSVNEMLWLVLFALADLMVIEFIKNKFFINKDRK